MVTEGALAGTRITLGSQPVLIGRADDSTLVLTDDYASTRHARLSQRGSEWYVEDLGSTNGTYLDRAKVTTAVRVPIGHAGSNRQNGNRAAPVTLVLRYAARSDRGLVRANNEDSVYAGARLLALADGMGGHAAGEVASQLVIAALAHLDDDEPGGDLLSKLDAAVREGNSAIAAHVEADPELEGMGTTLTAILFAGNRLGLVHIGDSRGYLLRDGELAQITKDDTFVQTLVDEGRITAEEAHSHPQRSLIMRALTGHEVEPTLIMREARAGDRYLLCSDGLSDPVSHETILEALQIADVAESADRLIELALRGGGPDNVTVVVADVVDYDYGQTQPILAGAVSGDDDQVAPPEHLGRPRVRVQPAAATRPNVLCRSRRRCRKPPRSRRRMLIAAVLLVLAVLAGLAVGREIVRSNYYVTAARRHRVDHARCSGLLSRLPTPGALPARLPERTKRSVAHRRRAVPRQPRLPDVRCQRHAAVGASAGHRRACRRAAWTTPSPRSRSSPAARCCRRAARARRTRTHADHRRHVPRSPSAGIRRIRRPDTAAPTPPAPRRTAAATAPPRPPPPTATDHRRRSRAPTARPRRAAATATEPGTNCREVS